ncbi:MAG: hypothetical protein B6229_07055 [Spirochaetaceae bacterium 4572_7]|nr:MAG: hypothetical protein B6229_07055 [Spirochaetaceae bacterium 4572_7]
MNKMAIFPLIFLFFVSCSGKDNTPVYGYYKNIPILRGWTNDEVPQNYIIEVVLVYRNKNTDLQTRINSLKPILIDKLRYYFSTLSEDDYLLENQEELKLGAVTILNNVILDYVKPKKAEKIKNMKNLEEQDLILDIDILQLQIFNLN